jgi:DNA invertase Pin-like site-specific DNA recombinase
VNDLISASHCAVGDCERPTRGGRTLCEAHEKRKQRGQSLTAELAERLTPKQRLLEACNRWIETDPEDDVAYEANERAVVRAAKAFAPATTGEIIREALAAARARGVRLGRPPELQPEDARRMVKRLGTITLAARALGVDRKTVRAALGRGEKTGILPRSATRERRVTIQVFASASAASAP